MTPYTRIRLNRQGDVVVNHVANKQRDRMSRTALSIGELECGNRATASTNQLHHNLIRSHMSRTHVSIDQTVGFFYRRVTLMKDGFDEGACDVFVVSPLDSLVPAEAKRFFRLADTPSLSLPSFFFLLRLLINLGLY